MKLGLCCISEILKDKGFSFQTITRKRFLSLPREEAKKVVHDRTINNLQVTSRIIKHCAQNNIKHYRLSSSLFPAYTDQQCFDSWEEVKSYSLYKDLLSKCGKLLKQNNITVSTHPSQYIVMFNKDDKIINNSIIDLELHGWIHDCLDLPQDYSNPINIHPTGTFESVQDAFDIFVNNLNKLSDSAKKRLVLENCDKAYWNMEKLFEFWQYYNHTTNQDLPLTFDNLHNECNKPSDLFGYFLKTWRDFTPIFHWSEGGANGKIRSHVDYFSNIPQIILDNPQIIWECEVKAKDKAILKILNK